MKLFNQLLNNKFNLFNKLSIILFSILPISVIIGNAAININIVLINLLFLIYCYKFEVWGWVKKDIFLYLITLYIFLNLNSLYSYFILFKGQTPPIVLDWDNRILSFYNEDFILKFYDNDGIKRSFLFIKFILLVFAFSILLRNNKILDLVNKNWLFVIIILIIDVFIEKFTGQNILGYKSPDPSRIVSFFKDELVVGGLILCFGLTSTSYFINNKKNNKSIFLITLILLLVVLSIFITGEKSNFIKSILLFLIIAYFFKKNKYYINYKILLIVLSFLITFFVVFSDITRQKYYETFLRIKVAKVETTIFDKFQNIKYFSHYDTAIKIFKNYPITGIGNKNFRIECHKNKYFNEKINATNIRCATHPHQVHLEILSEQGIVGYFLIFYFVIWFSIKNIKISLKNKNVYHLSNVGYLLIFFIPVLPGSGIFSTFSGSMFWIMFALVNLNYEKKKNEPNI